jgi:DNA phosphorothioation-dependent restriction protein DptG
MILIANLQRQTKSSYRLAFDHFKDIHDLAKNKKTKVIQGIIKVTSSDTYKAFSKWANYSTYAKLTLKNLEQIKAITGVINFT